MSRLTYRQSKVNANITFVYDGRLVVAEVWFHDSMWWFRHHSGVGISSKRGPFLKWELLQAAIRRERGPRRGA